MFACLTELICNKNESPFLHSKSKTSFPLQGRGDKKREKRKAERELERISQLANAKAEIGNSSVQKPVVQQWRATTQPKSEPRVKSDSAHSGGWSSVDTPVADSTPQSHVGVDPSITAKHEQRRLKLAAWKASQSGATKNSTGLEPSDGGQNPEESVSSQKDRSTTGGGWSTLTPASPQQCPPPHSSTAPRSHGTIKKTTTALAAFGGSSDDEEESPTETAPRKKHRSLWKPSA